MFMFMFMMKTPFNSIFFTLCALTLFLGKRNKMAGAQQCWANPPTPSTSTETGKVEDFGGLRCYLSGPADAKAAVIMITDIFGIDTGHLRMIADKVAAAGYYVVAPDFFQDCPYVTGHTPYRDWINVHPADKALDASKPILEALNAKGMTKIGAVGFCWGAKAVVEFSKIPCIQAAVLIHPSSITVDDIKGVKVPMSMLGAELDDVTKLDLFNQYEEALNSLTEVDHFSKVFIGCGHGWSLRYDDNNKVAVENAEESHRLMLEWLVNHVK